MKEILFIALTLFFMLSFAQTVNTENVKSDASAAFTELASSSNVAKWRNTVASNASSIVSIKSSFKQVKTLSFLSQKVTSGGRFFFEKSENGNKLKWEYTTPFFYTIVINGNNITMKDGQKISSFDMSTSRVFQEINEIMVASLNGTILSDEGNFIFDIKEKGRELTISMTPVKGTSLSEYFRNINMIMDKSDFTVSMLTMVEITGDSTKLLFIDKKLNGKIDESEFSVK
ncbi:MAG TPA: outer membrane lipoprotein carrier protein LolA [bacterium]|nr:outer membrane lipoprotein carrier protein LolA [bacterium]